MNYDEITISEVLNDVYKERVRQQKKWGQQDHKDGTGPLTKPLANTDVNLDSLTGEELASLFTGKTDRYASLGMLSYKDIFLEEVFEAMAEEDKSKLREELVQCAAVAVAWCEKIDRDVV